MDHERADVGGCAQGNISEGHQSESSAKDDLVSVVLIHIVVHHVQTLDAFHLIPSRCTHGYTLQTERLFGTVCEDLQQSLLLSNALSLLYGSLGLQS